MNLIFEFGGPNEGFTATYTKIYEKFNQHYPDINKTHVLKGIGHCDHTGGRCGISSMAIINADNNKATVLAFWDRGTEIIFGNSWSGWAGVNIVHCIGGLGVSIDRLPTFPIKFTPFHYPLEKLVRYDYIQNYRRPYVPIEKVQKACFIGNIYNGREKIVEELRKHPLFDIYGIDANYHNSAYFEKMSEYVLTLSLNGNGELCMRDFESMGLGIPVVRSEVKSMMSPPFIDGQNYIKGAAPSFDAWFVYGGKDVQIAEQFIHSVETVISNHELLNTVSQNGIQYFDEYCYPEKIAEKFFDVFDLDILR